MTVLRRLVAATILVAAALPAAASEAGDARLRAAADAFIDGYYLPQQPTQATSLGVHAYDSRLEDYSRRAVTTQVRELHAWERRFAAFRADELSEHALGDQQLLLGTVRSALQTLEVLKPWQNNPDTYSSGIAASAFALMERRFAPPDVRLRALIARERRMPAVLAEARKNLVNPPKVYTEVAIEQLPGLVAFFERDVPAAFADVADPALAREFRTVNSAVIGALRDYHHWLENTLLPASHGDFRIGREQFRRKLAYDEMVDTPLDDLLALDLENMRANQQEFNRIAHELAPDKAPAEVLDELGADHPAPDKTLDAFRATFTGLISFIESHHIITIPSRVLPIVEETPPFMRATTFASMDTPGPFEHAATEAYFNVTLPEPGWDDTRVREFMAQFSYPVISSVATHEAYPGHYVQFLWMANVNDRVRKILGANSNAEGWAHYCEQMMLDEGLAQALFPDDPRAQKLLRLGQLQDALLRNARFYVGIQMHTGTMTMDEAVQFFVKEGYQSPAVGLVETKRGTSNPTYLYYTLGKLEIQKLRRDVAAREGARFNVQSFHDAFMREGFPPIAIVRRAMLHDDSPAL